MFCPTLRTSLRLIRGLSSLQLKRATEQLVRTTPVFLTNFENRRSLFSDEYLGLDAFIKTSKHVRFATTDDEAFKASMEAVFDKSGLHSVFTEDIIKLINLATSDSDFDFVKKILVETMRYNFRKKKSFLYRHSNNRGPWWPSGLIHNVSNSSRDRLCPMFESR